MKDISKFGDVVGTPSKLGSLDASGSSIDIIFAQAVMANEPTTLLEENGIIRVQVAPPEKDKVSFPIIRNTQFTWTTIGRGTNDTGSDLAAQALNAVEYKEVTPVTKTMNLFLPDNVSLLNEVNFNVYSEIGARDAKRQKEADGLSTLTTEANVGLVKVAGGYSAATGSVGAGSKLTPLDLIKAQTALGTGSNINKPDFVLMHDNQYAQLNTHSDFAPGASTNGAMMMKAKFDADGNIVRFAGMDIYVSELVPVGTGGYYASTGHPVIVGTKGKCLGRGEHSPGITINTEDSRRLHGQWKIFDMDYGHTVLVKEAIVLLRAAD
jgi:hypothetical protein